MATTTFEDEKGREVVIEIEGYQGESQYDLGGLCEFEFVPLFEWLKYFPTFIGKRLRFELVSDNIFEFEGLISASYVVTMRVGNELVFKGATIPLEYGEPVENPPFLTRVECVDFFTADDLDAPISNPTLPALTYGTDFDYDVQPIGNAFASDDWNVGDPFFSNLPYVEADLKIGKRFLLFKSKKKLCKELASFLGCTFYTDADAIKAYVHDYSDATASEDSEIEAVNQLDYIGGSSLGLLNISGKEVIEKEAIIAQTTILTGTTTLPIVLQTDYTYYYEQLVAFYNKNISLFAKEAIYSVLARQFKGGTYLNDTTFSVSLEAFLGNSAVTIYYNWSGQAWQDTTSVGVTDTTIDFSQLKSGFFVVIPFEYFEDTGGVPNVVIVNELWRLKLTISALGGGIPTGTRIDFGMSIQQKQITEESRWDTDITHSIAPSAVSRNENWKIALKEFQDEHEIGEAIGDVYLGTPIANEFKILPDTFDAIVANTAPPLAYLDGAFDNAPISLMKNPLSLLKYDFGKGESLIQSYQIIINMVETTYEGRFLVRKNIASDE